MVNSSSTSFDLPYHSLYQSLLPPGVNTYTLRQLNVAQCFGQNNGQNFLFTHTFQDIITFRKIKIRLEQSNITTLSYKIEVICTTLLMGVSAILLPSSVPETVSTQTSVANVISSENQSLFQSFPVAAVAPRRLPTQNPPRTQQSNGSSQPSVQTFPAGGRSPIATVAPFQRELPPLNISIGISEEKIVRIAPVVEAIVLNHSNSSNTYAGIRKV